MRLSVRRNIFSTTLLAAVFAVAGCASGGASAGESAGPEGEGAADGMSTITVQNNHTSGQRMQIYMEPDGRGQRIQVGFVQPGATASFTQDVPRGWYTLHAMSDAGSELTSNRFNVGAPSTLNWTLSTRRLTVSRR